MFSTTGDQLSSDEVDTSYRLAMSRDEVSMRWKEDPGHFCVEIILVTDLPCLYFPDIIYLCWDTHHQN
jgi:hypothetical protein